MSQYILTIIDTAGIQDYIFATNSLRQNAGASFLADCATGAWVKEVLDIIAIDSHNVISLSSKEDRYKVRPSRENECDPCSDKEGKCEFLSIEKDNLQAELIYTGGGNAVLLFDTIERAKHFTEELTRRVMIRAPGLHIVVNHTPFEWEKAVGGKGGVLDTALYVMKKRKRSRPPTYPVLGLGVSSRCVFTGLPAIGYDKDKRSVSVVADAKERQELNRSQIGDTATSHGRLLASLTFDFDKFILARDFDKLGVSPDESSLIAIVHADGNSMGKRKEAIRDAHKTPSDNRIVSQRGVVKN